MAKLPTAGAGRAGGLEAGAARLLARPATWVVLVLALASWPVASALLARRPPPLPVLVELPRFQLVDEEGRRFGTPELEGRVWVASFIFTRCATICPAITAKMARIQERTRDLAPSFHLVSFSVDPEYDTPERLAAYARAHRASPRLWTFLTGPEDEVREAVVGGLKMAMGREASADGRLDGVFHGSHLVLVDGRGRVRGYYDSEEEGMVDRVVRDAGRLVSRGG